MRITSLNIHNLRNLEQVSLKPVSGANVFCGPNGAGKTTVIESLMILAKGQSFRGGTNASLIGPHGDQYVVRAGLLDDQDKKHQVALQRGRSEWEGRIDGESLAQISDTARFFPMILMEPMTHQLVSGPPEGRRRYLDWTVFHVKQDFLMLWRRYVRTLKQRNAALRERDTRIVKSLDPQMVTLGAQLGESRQEVFDVLHPEIIDSLASMSPGQGELELSLQQGWNGDSLQEALDEGLGRDLEQGYTREGPHRADIVIKMEGRAVRDRLSRGEQKILAAAMCLAQGKVFSDSGHVPVLLLDDIASEFDEAHLRAVVLAGKTMGSQMFITGTSSAPYVDFLPADGLMFHVKHGQITPEKKT